MKLNWARRGLQQKFVASLLIVGFAPGAPAQPSAERPSLLSYGLSVEEIEKAMLQEALEKAKGNVSEAARLLKVTRNTLRYRMGKYNLTSPEES